MLYFAYGVNLDHTQMHLRCPDARYVGKARLDGYGLCFPRWSEIRLSAVVSVEPVAGETVWGILYGVGEADVARLDQREGYNPRRRPVDNTRNRAAVTVIRSDGQSTDAELYVATPTEGPGQPSPEYIAYLRQLAVACDLPADYRAMLATIGTVQIAA